MGANLTPPAEEVLLRPLPDLLLPPLLILLRWLLLNFRPKIINIILELDTPKLTKAIGLGTNIILTLSILETYFHILPQ